ncbi:hypothetical protein FB45DRAFT_297232 [Roridomyces roridus]|uniref:Uncharacterized protein n=1 Tax=Roridomyces roridus TaxID=1738132 RepID=A0AAD7FUW8_9AGAR|nr:hypothetical protein FB45DRAFT_297232 [Roridomyces roridus]
MDVPPQLMFSALTWDGWPSSSSGDDGDVDVGTYKEAASVRLQKRGPSAIERDALEYVPVATTSFKYERRAYTGNVADDGSRAVVGLGISPAVLSICLPGRVQWPERFPPCPAHQDPVPRSLTGPPFEFYTVDFSWDTTYWEDSDTKLSPDGLHGLYLTGPDLPWQGQQDPFDADDWYPWTGDWVTALLEQKDKRKNKNQPLGEMKKVFWTYDRMWAVEMRLEAVQVREFEEGGDSDEEGEDDEKNDERSISDYTVRATVLKVLVKKEGLDRLHEPDPPVPGDSGEKQEDEAAVSGTTESAETQPTSMKRKAEGEPGEALDGEEVGDSKKRTKK